MVDTLLSGPTSDTLPPMYNPMYTPMGAPMGAPMGWNHSPIYNGGWQPAGGAASFGGGDAVPPFTWSECHSLIPTDAAGVLVRLPSAWPVVKLQVQLQLPLLYMAERESWSC